MYEIKIDGVGDWRRCQEEAITSSGHRGAVSRTETISKSIFHLIESELKQILAKAGPDLVYSSLGEKEGQTEQPFTNNPTSPFTPSASS